jgi:superfamily II DNA or RNA helicase
MAGLRPAGLLAAIGSIFFPKRLVVHVRTEVLANGQVQVTPVFTVDGYEVPSEFIRPDTHQNVLGYNVVLDRPSLNVHRQSQGKPIHLAKRKAAEFLAGLHRSGVPVRARDDRIEPRIESIKPDVRLALETDDSLRIHSELITANGIVVDKPRDLGQLQEDDGWYADGDDLLHVELSDTPLDNLLVAEGGASVLDGEDVPRFLKMLQEEATHVGSVEKNQPLKLLSVFSGKPKNCARVDGDESSISVSASLTFPHPEGREYEPTAEELLDIEQRGGGFKRVAAGWTEVSPQSISRFRNACLDLTRKLGPLDDVRGSDIPKVLSALMKAGRRAGGFVSPWSVYFSERVTNAHRVIDGSTRIQFRLNIVESDGRSLLSLDPIYNHERFQLRHGEVEQAITSGEEWVRRRNAWIKLDQDKFEQVADGIKTLDLQATPEGFTFPARQREHVIELFSVLGSIEHTSAYADFLLKLADFERIEDAALPSNLRPEISLRTYQKHGFNWLAFLYRFGLNGILADDMGLGKTLQSLAVIQRAREIATQGLPSLIICPTSVVDNWKSEIHKFFMNCEVIIYTGGARDGKLQGVQNVKRRPSNRPISTLVITSYDIARMDHEKLNRIPWHYLVVDEGHNIKNPDAKRTKAIKTIHAQHKLALTGTPIQNNLEELWSLFDYAMPGFLGSRSAFRQLYGRNGRVNWHAVRNGSAALKERVHPFILRRLKEDVAKELPQKTIVTQKVELTPPQVALYKQVLNSAEHRRLLEQVNEKGVERSKVLILAVFTKLRAICNHPVLAQRQREAASIQFKDSGKLDALKELVEEIVDGEHRALLFSQSTQMLDIIEVFFKKWKISNIRLDGNTPQHSRQVLVDEFNRNSRIHCFLISTKAGGTGLNLTGADTVIFYDHDWNPANDIQAQDRAHRIGQTKPVTVYKLVSKGTIEERILERQEIKQTLADEIIGSDEGGFKDLTKEELLALFELDQDVE